MRPVISSLLIGASVIGPMLTAFAGEGYSTIMSIDTATGSVTLEDGSKWEIAPGQRITHLQPGDRVYVTFDDGTTVLTSITKTE